jgi:hypothetical protein
MVRRTPALTKQVRAIYEERLFADGYWPFAFFVSEQVGLTAEQVRGAVWAPAADDWRRDVLRRYNERRQDAHS